MTAPSANTRPDDDPVDLDTLPETVASGSTLLVATPEPIDEYALPLRIADRYARSDECRLVVTATVDAERTIRQQLSVSPSPAPGFGVVDATGDEHLLSLYQEYPTVYLPYPGELAHVSLALWELETALSPSRPNPHLIFRSLSPLLAEDSLERVTNVLGRLIEQRRSSGSLTVLGVEYTAHDEHTMAALRALADAVVWVDTSPDARLELEYRRIRNR